VAWLPANCWCALYLCAQSGSVQTILSAMRNCTSCICALLLPDGQQCHAWHAIGKQFDVASAHHIVQIAYYWCLTGPGKRTARLTCATGSRTQVYLCRSATTCMDHVYATRSAVQRESQGPSAPFDDRSAPGLDDSAERIQLLPDLLPQQCPDFLALQCICHVYEGVLELKRRSA
jgi:hypothetical protein